MTVRERVTVTGRYEPDGNGDGQLDDSDVELDPPTKSKVARRLRSAAGPRQYRLTDEERQQLRQAVSGGQVPENDGRANAAFRAIRVLFARLMPWLPRTARDLGDRRHAGPTGIER
jgi:hypothetical protein